jgi:hypothetical protein
MAQPPALLCWLGLLPVTRVLVLCLLLQPQ